MGLRRVLPRDEHLLDGCVLADRICGAQGVDQFHSEGMDVWPGEEPNPGKCLWQHVEE